VSDVLLFSLTAALNPTLLTATTVMLLLPNPKRLLLGYLLGALTTGITVGLVVIEWLGDSNAVSTTKRTLDPMLDIVIGVLLLVVASTVRSDRWGKRRREKEGPDGAKHVPHWQETLGRGTARTTFVIGLLLSFPGASYLACLTAIYRQGLDWPATVATVVAANLVMLVLLELPLIGYVVAPQWTPHAVAAVKRWIGRNAQRAIVVGCSALGLVLIARGVISLATA
jgi:hypothetical protein